MRPEGGDQIGWRLGWLGGVAVGGQKDGTVREGSSLTSVRSQGKEQWCEAVAVGRLIRTSGRHEDMMRSSGSWFWGDDRGSCSDGMNGLGLAFK